MKVLLSAYACGPNLGSEPGVGWNWALEIARLGHEVWVITRANNHAVIEMELAKSPPVKNLEFIYYDLPAWARWWKKGIRGIHLYYLLWQWGAFRLAKRVHQEVGFGLVHHITFVGVRQPSFMGNLGIPFIFGPVGGGERAPWRLRTGYGWRGWLKDFLRDLANYLTRIDPLVRRTFKQAERIYVTSEQTRSLLPQKYREKASVQLAIGFKADEMPRWPEKIPRPPINKECFRILFVGRLIYWKGMHLGFPAFASVLKKFPNARLTIVGKGPDEKRWRRLAKNLKIEERIEWIPWLARKELGTVYNSHNVFLFPSLHDSGGMVVLEAMAHGLPIICLDLGGAGVIVTNDSGRVISTKGKLERQISNDLAKALIELGNNPALRRKIGSSAKKRMQKFIWQQTVKNIYQEERGIDISPVKVNSR